MKFLTVILSLTLFNFAKSNTCYQDEKNPFSYFATETAYSFVSGKEAYSQPNCKTLQLWMLSRHGTRHPSEVLIDRMNKLYAHKNTLTDKSSLCQKDQEAIKNWKLNLTIVDGYTLNNQGIIDLLSLGSRLRNSYGDIFNIPTTYRILSSSKSQCVNSASYFLKAAFNDSNANIPTANQDDIRLHILKLKNVDVEDDLIGNKNEEVQKFINSTHIKDVLFRVSKTLGLDQNLTLETVELMYASCRYEKSLQINSHPAWCAVFSKEDLEVLEYAEDLKYYYSNGYGDLNNERLGCPIVKDLITNFKDKDQKQLGPKGIFFFGHSYNVFSAIVRLGFAKDSTRLLASNFKEMQDRKWRSSKLSPFASNVMAVLYECQGEKKVTFFVNEIPMSVEQHDCVLCPWKLIEKTFNPIISDPSCTFDSQTPSSASLFSGKSILFILSCLFCARYTFI